MGKMNGQELAEFYIKNQKLSSPNMDLSHRCILRCPQCLRQKVEGLPRIKRSFDIGKPEFRKILNYYENQITFCGQISDPIYHPDFLAFLEMMNGLGKGLRVATNGTNDKSGNMDDKWWEKAYSYGLGENCWVFGVDGLDEKSELYRIGSNFKQVWETMKMGVQAGHPIVWQFIIFGYNEHEIEQAKEIAHKEGITLLLIKTNRGFDPRSRTLRKNVQKQYENFQKPSEKNTVKKIKSEEYFNVTPELERWRKVRQGAFK
jgi:MoaA/NifB/PqqE/SkfB family radical SAM enzyme|nr:Molybdenum cofactor biosynthesis enzyme-like protein [uncultured Mediterranean phage uvMED]BAR29773.1 Molybdenum cofactor biosynthesis enzyme-like protein [uncultured Mediterranean phage uvMED]BAR29818.1 Molybdenum cofactor biosynthesis enzyme-like protein [uncultured Mediterranean phage uvMED]